MLEALKIALFSVAAAVSYGILHDVITAHLCVEYFSIAHPPVIESDSPIALALVWGVIAIWWVGLGLGLLLALAARAGPRPPAPFAVVRKSVVMVMMVSACLALLFALAGASLYVSGILTLADYWAETIEADRQLRFFTAAAAHQGSYLGAFVAGLFVIVRTWRSRA